MLNFRLGEIYNISFNDVKLLLWIKIEAEKVVEKNR